MKFSLQHKVAVVTGGGSGIGKAICKTFAEAGATVYILEMNMEAAEETVSEINTAQGNAHGLNCDISNPAAVAATFEKIETQAGKVDILVNNAGIAHVGNLENTTEADLDRLYQVNIKGVYNCAKAAVLIFKKNGGGVILNMASIVSSIAVADRFAYSMTKGAVLTMTYSIAKDYLQDNIRCNSISPARIHTPFVDGFIAKNYPGQEQEMFDKLSKTQPIGRMGTPQEVGDLALYLCSQEASFITGTDFPIDGGFIKLQG